MKAILINGSPKKSGNTYLALEELRQTLVSEGVEAEIIHVGHLDIHGCIACGKCKETGACAIDDIVREVSAKFRDADALVVGTPVYYASPAGTLISFLDRLFHSSIFDKSMKLGASVAVARRAGTTASLDVLNKYFTINNMPVVSSNYWNVAHGLLPGEVEGDEEGLQTMRQLGHNMAFLLKSIALGKEKYGMPKRESKVMTNFIR